MFKDVVRALQYLTTKEEETDSNSTSFHVTDQGSIAGIRLAFTLELEIYCFTKSYTFLLPAFHTIDIFMRMVYQTESKPIVSVHTMCNIINGKIN